MNTEREDAEMIEEVAAGWLAEREDGLSPARAREFERWCRQDSRHAASVAHLEQACALLRKMPQVRKELQPVVEFPVPARLAPRTEARRRNLPASRVVAGLAAALVLVTLSWWQWPKERANVQFLATSAGGYERVVLADGSVVELNSNTEVSVSLAPGERRVALAQGEAHFTVAHDTARPFIVEAGRVAVRAVGTAFNVRLASTAVEVLVTEGRVTVSEVEHAASHVLSAGAEPDPLQREIRRHPARAILAANERLLIPTVSAKGPSGAAVSPAIEKVESSAIHAALSWQERKLVFAETPLRNVAAQFNRHNRLQLVVGDPVLAERPMGGTFAADNVEGFVRLLERSGTVAVERRGEFEIVLRQIP